MPVIPRHHCGRKNDGGCTYINVFNGGTMCDKHQRICDAKLHVYTLFKWHEEDPCPHCEEGRRKEEEELAKQKRERKAEERRQAAEAEKEAGEQKKKDEKHKKFIERKARKDSKGE